MEETKFNSCLLNLYHNGNEGIAWKLVGFWIHLDVDVLDKINNSTAFQDQQPTL
ncbi:MAG: hypothetical protein WB988_09485 [Candidatus Nitrosopolaris sp.]